VSTAVELPIPSDSIAPRRAVPRLRLASRSPRRRELLHSAGFEHEVVDAGIDDGQLASGHSTAEQWVTALSYLKARAGWERLGSPERSGAVVLGADTVVSKNGRIIGQPRDESDARQIIESLENGEHTVLTGVTLICSDSTQRTADRPDRPMLRRTFTDAARVKVGSIGEPAISTYLAAGGWRGKAGAYNLSERLADGWPITYEGDPGTIMGLPMQRLTPLLLALLNEPRD